MHGPVKWIKAKLYLCFCCTICVLMCAHVHHMLPGPRTQATIAIHQSVDMITCSPPKHSLLIITSRKIQCSIKKRRVREVVSINENKSFCITCISGRFVCRVRAEYTINSLGPWNHVFDLDPEFFFLWFII